MGRMLRVGFVVVWLLVAAVTATVWGFEQVHPEFLGIVETRTHKLGPADPGRVREVRVALGDPVTDGQVLAVMDAADLEAERDGLRRELAGIEALAEADRVRYGLEYAKLRLQGDASAAGIGARRAELESKRGELAALDAEIERLRQAERAGLGRSRDLADLQIRRNAVAAFVREAASSAGARATKGQAGVPGVASDAENVVRSMLSDRVERTAELKRQIGVLDERIASRRIVSPCDGHVVKVDIRPGDVVRRFTTVLTVEEPQAAFVDVYIPENSDTEPRLGQRVRIRPQRAGAGTPAGTVSFIDPGYSQIPERLAFRNLLYWARKFRVRLDDGHRMMPGESAKVEMLPEVAEVPASQAPRAGVGRTVE